MIRIEIPVEPHVQKYLTARYGPTYTAGRTSLIGVEVLNSLTRKYEKPEKSIPWKFYYPVYITERYMNHNGHTISRNNLQHLGIVLGLLFSEDLKRHLDLKLRDGAKALPELKAWLQLHNITEDDVKVETLYKTYQRHCKMSITSKKKVA